MTIADLVILSILGIVTILVVINSLRKVKKGHCAGCSHGKNTQPKWIKDYKRDL